MNTRTIPRLMMLQWLAAVALVLMNVLCCAVNSVTALSTSASASLQELEQDLQLAGRTTALPDGPAVAPSIATWGRRTRVKRSLWSRLKASRRDEEYEYEYEYDEGGDDEEQEYGNQEPALLSSHPKRKSIKVSSLKTQPRKSHPQQQQGHKETVEDDEKQEEDEEDEEDVCPICLDSFQNTDTVVTQCNHTFHQSCFQRLALHNQDRACPTCRSPLFKADLVCPRTPVHHHHHSHDHSHDHRYNHRHGHTPSAPTSTRTTNPAPAPVATAQSIGDVFWKQLKFLREETSDPVSRYTNAIILIQQAWLDMTTELKQYLTHFHLHKPLTLDILVPVEQHKNVLYENYRKNVSALWTRMNVGYQLVYWSAIDQLDASKRKAVSEQLGVPSEHPSHGSIIIGGDDGVRDVDALANAIASASSSSSSSSSSLGVLQSSSMGGANGPDYGQGGAAAITSSSSSSSSSSSGISGNSKWTRTKSWTETLFVTWNAARSGTDLIQDLFDLLVSATHAQMQFHSRFPQHASSSSSSSSSSSFRSSYSFSVSSASNEGGSGDGRVISSPTKEQVISILSDFAANVIHAQIMVPEKYLST